MNQFLLFNIAMTLIMLGHVVYSFAANRFFKEPPSIGTDLATAVWVAFVAVLWVIYVIIKAVIIT